MYALIYSHIMAPNFFLVQVALPVHFPIYLPTHFPTYLPIHFLNLPAHPPIQPLTHFSTFLPTYSCTSQPTFHTPFIPFPTYLHT